MTPLHEDDDMKPVSKYLAIATMLSSGALAGCLGDAESTVLNLTDPNGPAPVVATQLGFRVISAPDARADFTVEVEIQDAAGNLVTDASDNVTIDFGTNAGRLLFHASGISALGASTDSLGGGIFLELVDIFTQEVFVLSEDDGMRDREHVGANYDPASGMVYLVNRGCELIRSDPADGTGTVVDDHCNPSSDPTSGTSTYFKALTFESGTGRMLAGQRPSGTTAGILFEVDPTTAVPTALGPLFTNAGDSINGYNGMAVDPTTGTIWGVVRLATTGERCLVTIDPTTLIATIVGVPTDTGIAGITFLADGSLFALSGDGGSIPETLFTMDKTTAAMDSVMFLGHGADGESLTYVPAELSGTLTAAAVGGVATFTIQLSATADGYTLSATSGALTAATSSAFSVGGLLP